MNLNIVSLFITDDKIAPRYTESCLTLNKEDVKYKVRGHTIGEIINQSKGWLDEETQSAIAFASATACGFIEREILKLPSMKSWEGTTGCIRLAMASQTLYVILERPCDGKVSLLPAHLSEWPEALNAAQSAFEFREPHMSSAAYEGCTIAIPYKLINSRTENNL